MDSKAHYDQTDFRYDQYWKSRRYEHESEVSAIEKLLFGYKFQNIIDLGGGFGRLAPVLSSYCTGNINVMEHSDKQREIGQIWLSERYSNITFTKSDINNLNITPHTADLVSCVRVMHHFPDTQKVFKDIRTILKPKSFLLLEYANANHFLSHHKFKTNPIDIRSQNNQRQDVIPFVNHNPKTIESSLKSSGFKILNRLSVSNFRNPIVKKIIPLQILVSIEELVQEPLSFINFGPSIFLLAQKIDTTKNP